MKIKRILLTIILGLAVICIMSGILLAVSNQRQERELLQKQQELAELLDVDIADYPTPNRFPFEYYYTVLEEGMSIDEVHEIVRGYMNVYHRQRAEIYLFYYEDNSQAMPLKILYDDNFRFVTIVAGDPDSGGITLSGSEPGRIGE